MGYGEAKSLAFGCTLLRLQTGLGVSLELRHVDGQGDPEPLEPE